MVAIDLQPYSVIENEGFKQLVKVLDPKYVLPSKTTLKNNYMEHYITAKTKLQIMLNKI